MLLLEYLTNLKESVPREVFEELILIVESEIKFNRIPLGRKTNCNEFIKICEKIKSSYGLC